MLISKCDVGYLLAKKSLSCYFKGVMVPPIHKGNRYSVKEITTSFYTLYIINGRLFDDNDIHTYFYTKREERELKLKTIMENETINR